MIGSDITLASQYLSQGETVAIPTETVYGLAANAFDPEASAKVYQVKNRPSFDPLIVHTHHIDEVGKFTVSWPQPLHQLAQTFWPGPLTVLLEKSDVIPDLVTSGMQRVAVRIPDHPLAWQLLQKLSFPLVAPSANPFGYVSPTTATHVSDQLGDKIPYILDGGPCGVGIESTIVGMESDQVTIYRLGGLAKEVIEEVVGSVTVKTSSSNPQAPGMLTSHYAPKKKVVLGTIDTIVDTYDGTQGVILFKPNDALKGYHISVLSPRGSDREAATNIFSALRLMDRSDVDTILAEILPEQGLGRAINDRLRRASS